MYFDTLIFKDTVTHIWVEDHLALGYTNIEGGHGLVDWKQF